jgi:hypothetical protein
LDEALSPHPAQPPHEILLYRAVGVRGKRSRIMPSPVDLRGVARAAAAESAERLHAAGAAMHQHAAKRQQHAASSAVHLAHRISQLCSARLVAVSKR